MEIDPDDYLDPGYVATRLGISPETVRRWARQGRVRAVKIGDRWRVHRDTLLVAPAGGSAPATEIDSQK